jgi:pimeloyl-ACP methyl ester carboxylesterase
VIAWLAQQPWCSGRVGLMGISWGGFNALQIAALRPPALGAVISACSTDDLGSPEGAPPLDYEVVDGRLKLPDGLESWAQNRDEHSLESDPLSARVDCHRLYGLERDDWQTHVEIDAHMTCDADRFHVETRLQAYEGDTRVHERAWNSSTPRNLR